MVDLYPPLQFLLLVFAEWVNRQQREIIAYLKEENRILREKMSKEDEELSHATTLPARHALARLRLARNLS
jgi:hypothetical protein